jgi:hypothetical protein
VTLGGGVGGRGCMAGRSAVGGVAPRPSRETEREMKRKALVSKPV